MKRQFSFPKMNKDKSLEKDAEATDTSLIYYQSNDNKDERLTIPTDGSKVGFGDIFSVRRPKDLGAGVSSGIKSVVKGVGLGLFSLVGTPTYRACQEGLTGFLKGLGEGVLLAIVLPIAGIGVGITQAARGALNTPEAVVNKKAGKKWNKKLREWVDDNYTLENELLEVAKLQEEIEQEIHRIKASADFSSINNNVDSNEVNVVDKTYYDYLNVSPAASQDDIRKAYYKLAKEYHPDKHPNDSVALESFKKIGEAYQVLGDVQRREAYNRKGKDALNEIPLVDAGVFFTMLFGSESFIPYIGKESFEKVMKFEQRKRIIHCAKLLRERLAPYTGENSEEWLQQMMKEASDLTSRSFGAPLVDAIGWVYINSSIQFLGRSFRGFLCMYKSTSGELESFINIKGRIAKMFAKNREMSNYFKVATSALKVSMAARKLDSVSELNNQNDTNKIETNNSENADTSSSQPEDLKRETSSSSKKSKESFFSKKKKTDNNDEKNDNPYKNRMKEVKQLEQTIPLVLDIILKYCLVDVEKTVGKVVKKVLRDNATPIARRRIEAEGLIQLGAVFQTEAKKYTESHKDDINDIFKQVEAAYGCAATDADNQ